MALVKANKSNGQHLFSTYCMPGMILSTLHALIHLIFVKKPSEGTETQEDCVIDTVTLCAQDILEVRQIILVPCLT
jgi:hypothetical protein